MKCNQHVQGNFMNCAKVLSIVDDHDLFWSYTFLFLSDQRHPMVDQD
jgi:hypothetical protein